MSFLQARRLRHIALEKTRVLTLNWYPEISHLTRDNPPIASFVIRVLSSVGYRKPLLHPQIIEQLLKNNDDFVWPIDVTLTGKFIIDVEFLDLTTSSSQQQGQGGEATSIGVQGSSIKRSNSAALNSLRRMLIEGIFTDITINTSDGCVKADRQDPPCMWSPMSPTLGLDICADTMVGNEMIRGISVVLQCILQSSVQRLLVNSQRRTGMTQGALNLRR